MKPIVGLIVLLTYLTAFSQEDTTISFEKFMDRDCRFDGIIDSIQPGDTLTLFNNVKKKQKHIPERVYFRTPSRFYASEYKKYFDESKGACGMSYGYDLSSDGHWNYLNGVLTITRKNETVLKLRALEKKKKRLIFVAL